MKTKIISILTVMALIINMIIPMGSVFATNQGITITFEANKTTASPGEEIEYTVKASSPLKIYTLQFYLDMPEGLTYVNNSGKLGSQYASLEEDEMGFQKNSLGVVFVMSKSAGFAFNNSVLGTFKCKLAENAKGGKYTVGIHKADMGQGVAGFEVYDKETVIDPETNEPVIDPDTGKEKIEFNDVTSYSTVNTATVTVNVENNPTGISLNKPTTTIEKGGTEKLIATVEPGDASNKTVTWVSSDTSVATVENDGTVTARNKGKATITAKTVNNFTADCVVTVTNPAKGIFIMKNGSVCKSDTIEKDAEITLTADVTPPDADNNQVTWTSSEPGVASVNNGVVKGLTKGSTIITAKTTNGIEATCTITVGIGLKSISLNEDKKTMKNGEEHTFTVTYNPEDADIEKKINWGSSNPEVATVNDSGKVTVHKCTGTATITATLNADNTKTASVVITAAHKDDKLTLHEAKAATCSAEGNNAYYTCSGCEDWYEDDTGSVKIENKESVKTPINKSAHDWDEGEVTTEPTCTTPGVLTKTCRNNSGHHGLIGIPELGHDMIKHDAKEPTCEKAGNIDYYTCSRCKKIFKDETGRTEITQQQTVINAKGHDWGDWVETTPATTESEGIETSTCKNDNTHIKTRKIPKIHKHELTKTDRKEATCSAEGNKEYWKCSVCEKTFSDSEGKNELENVVIPINKDAHDWDEWKTIKEPSCTEKGLKTRTCKINSSHTDNEELDMLPHTLEKVDEVKETCTTDGNKLYYKCTVCDKYFEDDTAKVEITDKESVKKSKLGHDWDEGKETTAATCTTDGIKTFTCKNDKSHTRTEVIPASHKLTKTDRKEATCVLDGNIEYYTCSVCNKKFSDESGKTEVTNVVLPINKDAHDWGEWKTIKEATVDETGLAERTCALNSEHTETKVIDRLPYEIKEGNGQTHYYDENNGIQIKANGSLEKLVRLLLDNTIELTENEVELKSGSTIATLKPAFLDTLPEGPHTLTFEYTDGSVNASFNVAKVTVPEQGADNTTTDTKVEQSKVGKSTTKNSSPITGDNIIIWISALAISALGILATLRFIKKKK